MGPYWKLRIGLSCWQIGHLVVDASSLVRGNPHCKAHSEPPLLPPWPHVSCAHCASAGGRGRADNKGWLISIMWLILSHWSFNLFQFWYFLEGLSIRYKILPIPSHRPINMLLLQTTLSPGSTSFSFLTSYLQVALYPYILTSDHFPSLAKEMIKCTIQNSAYWDFPSLLSFWITPERSLTIVTVHFQSVDI